jgi:hypothetical protein
MVRAGAESSAPSQPTRQRVRVELPCGQCTHQGICTIEEQIEQDVTLNIVGIGRPVRLYLGCSIFSLRRGPRDPLVTERIVASRRKGLESKVKRTVHPRAKGNNRRTFPTRRFAQPIDDKPSQE